jgi:multiple sugar transport system ATP-binding protein
MATIEFERATKRFADGTVAVDELSLEVEEGEFVILVGPSGCGKTTALRMIAGLEAVSSGEIRIGGRVVNDVPPSQRDVAMVFQSYALYPHMSVFDNIAFPLRQQKLPKAEVNDRVDDAVKLLGLGELLARKPKELSGGQRQRVAMGRALVRRPRAFLMDEPLSNLDAKLRVQMRAELIGLHRRLGITTVYVTHDQTEAMTLGDRVVVLDRGVVQQVDRPETLYRRPRNLFVAGFVGSPAMNFLEGRLEGGKLCLGPAELELPAAIVSGVARRDGDVLVGLRPEDVVLAPAGAPAPTLSAHVRITEQLGAELLAHLAIDGLTIAHVAGANAASADDLQELEGTFVARFDPAARLVEGERIELAMNSERIQLFDPDSGASLTAGRD